MSQPSARIHQRGMGKNDVGQLRPCEFEFNHQRIVIIQIKTMSTSPLRSAFSTQKRNIRDSNVSRYPNFTQKSPATNSPNLNEEEQPAHADLRAKLEILLKQNSQLLNENAQLSELVNSLRAEVEVRTRRQEGEFGRLRQELAGTTLELRGQQEAHQSELQRLLEEISRLHDQCHQLQIEKSAELRRQQQSHERQMVQQIAQMRRSQEESRSLMELQISRLRESIQLKDFELASQQSQSKSQLEQLRSQVTLLQSEADHSRRLKDLQLAELTRRSRDDMRAALRQLQLQKNVEIKQCENRLVKLRKELSIKDMEIQQLAKKSTGENQSVFLELSAVKHDKQALLEQIQSLTESTQLRVVREKERIAQLAQLEKENMENLFHNEKWSLIGEKQKLIALSVEKSEEIKRLYDTVMRMRQSADAERIELKSVVDGLRSCLREAQRSKDQQCELLKVKMAQLHRADVESLQSFYENQVAALHLQVNTLREAQRTDRQKLYTLLQENDELRKNFQVEISKQKAKIQDMKVKFAAARLEFKEQITSIGTKMELTSQSLIRETQQKQKGAQFFQTEKRKFYQIIQGKDKEIQQIHQTMIRLKQLNEEQITQLKSQINMLRDSLLAKDNEFKDFKSALQEEYQRRSTKLIEEHSAITPDDQLQKELHEVKGKLTEAEKDNFKKQKEIEFLTRENRSLQQELGLRAGFIETMQLESSAAIEDEKSKVKILLGKNQVALKDYYQNKLASREHDVQNLKKQLTEKESDLRGVVVKYSHLERRLKELMQAQNKLTDFENKIIHLGLDQNLIKNLGELFQRQQ